jgi:putative flippase GtrA
MFRFAAVGIANSIVDFIVFTLAYFGLAAGLVPANVIAYAVAATFSYFVNSRWTFAGRQRQAGARDFLTFQLVNLVGLVLATTVLVLLAQHTFVLVAKAVATGVSFFWSFTVLDRIVWPDKGRRDEPRSVDDL